LYVPVSSAEELVSTDPRHQCCTFRGSVVALDASNGNVLWKSYTITQEPKSVRKNKMGIQLWGPSGAAVWSAPTVDLEKHMIYSTTGDSYSDPAADTSDAFLAFRMETGELLWSHQTTSGDAFNLDCVRANSANCPQAKGQDFDFGSSPILVALPNGKRALIAGQKSGVVYAIDPDHEGAILWQKRVGRGGTLGGVQWGSAVDKSNVYVAVSDIALQTARSDGADMREQYNRDDIRPEPGIGGGLYALKLETGEVVWHTPHPSCSDKSDCRAAQSAAVTAIPGIVFSGSLDGHLRGYSAQSGQIIWDVDTKGDYQTVNGAAAHGGSLDGPGPVVVDGTLYVNSGYAIFGAIPGNVLLSFTVDGK
jgi:polyvinyl alcohol dehydrogenase (cytochrome)